MSRRRKVLVVVTDYDHEWEVANDYISVCKRCPSRMLRVPVVLYWRGESIPSKEMPACKSRYEKVRPTEIKSVAPKP